MAKRISKTELAAIEAAVAACPDGAAIQDIERKLRVDMPRRTLQYRLKHLVDRGRLVASGERRWARYRVAYDSPGHAETAPTSHVPLSDSALAIRRYVRQPIQRREPVGFDRRFLDEYLPNVSAYLSYEQRARLATLGQAATGQQPAGTYARQILNRLLIDLSWNSSRLEGNTYSLLDTRRLIHFGEAAKGKGRLEAQMILNHKGAIEFLVGSVEDIGFERHTILNLHALLADNLLPDPEATGRLRHIAVGIETSVFHPLEVPQLIDECFNQFLATASAIEDPFEQALFAMVHLPYLQPFDDVNKRVSRLAANIPLVRANLIPLSFLDVTARLYTEAILGVYELRQVDMMRDVFIWAYERSASRYRAVRQSLGEPDPFRMKYRQSLQDVVREVIKKRLRGKEALSKISSCANDAIAAAEREKFKDVVEQELLGLHAGNIARYRIHSDDFEAWQQGDDLDT